MTSTWRNLCGLGVAAAAFLLTTGCGTGPPGGGLTNGEPVMLGGPEKAAQRADVGSPDLTGGDASIAESARSSPAGTGNNAGTGGRNAGQGGTQTSAGTGQSAPEAASTPPASPPKLESPTDGGARGETKPAGNINTGTPRSPQ